MTHKNNRVGVFGGTFDPIHNGHLQVAQAAAAQLDLDSVLFIPAGHSYYKDARKDPVQDPVHRYNMSVLAAQSVPAGEAGCRFEVSDMEIRRPGNSYTCDTMIELEEMDPDAEYYLLIGADAFMNMRVWYRAEEIFSRCTVAVYGREDQTSGEEMTAEADYLREHFGAAVRIIEAPGIAISSKMIRSCIREGVSIHGLVPDAVETYIAENGIYSE